MAMPQPRASVRHSGTKGVRRLAYLRSRLASAALEGAVASKDEFVQVTSENFFGAWLGYVQSQDGNWDWEYDCAVTWSNWAPGQPDSLSHKQDRYPVKLSLIFWVWGFKC